MSRLLPIACLTLLGVFSLPARADDTLRQLLSSGATTASTYSTFKDHKLLIPAREDAGAFIASDGAIRGVYLEAALHQLRESNPRLQASDAQLARAILLGDMH